jgi:hypothetical protein
MGLGLEVDCPPVPWARHRIIAVTSVPCLRSYLYVYLLGQIKRAAWGSSLKPIASSQMQSVCFYLPIDDKPDVSSPVTCYV